MIDLEKIKADEAERMAYAEGYPGTARLFARIDELQQALADLENLTNERDQLRHDLEILKFERAYL